MQTLWILVAVNCVLLVTGNKFYQSCHPDEIEKIMRETCGSRPIRPIRSLGPEAPLTREDLLRELGALRGGRRSQRAIRKDYNKLKEKCCRSYCQTSDFASICNSHR